MSDKMHVKATSIHYYSIFNKGRQNRFTEVGKLTASDQRSRLMAYFLRRFGASLGKSNKKRKNPWTSPVSPSTARQAHPRAAAAVTRR
jgi:hypothetical protein